MPSNMTVLEIIKARNGIWPPFHEGTWAGQLTTDLLTLFHKRERTLGGKWEKERTDHSLGQCLYSLCIGQLSESF